jgi:LysM repeat protein
MIVINNRNIDPIVIDAGHGGEDPGAIGNGIIEKDLNLKISQYMYDRFRELGIPVKMTRTTDETLTPEQRTKIVLDAYGNNKDVIVISNHINAGGGDGAEVIYALRNSSTLSNLILQELAKEGQNIRKAYQRRLPSDTSKDYYFIQRDTGITQPVTVEYGFLDSTGDDVAQLKTKSDAFAEAVVRAVMLYLNKPYKAPAGMGYYTVKSGDSLWSIAKQFNTTVDAIKQTNNLTTNALTIGQTLKIPTVTVTPSPSEYITYTVKSGDNLYSIAKAYNTTVDAIKNLNNLTTTSLSLNQVLKLPITTTTPITPTEYINYAVKSGDNLYSIARAYNTTVDAIMKLNNLTSTSLSLGQTLKIPSTSTAIKYIVKSGDNLYSIASKFNTTVDAIKAKNNLTSNLLSLGQELII